MLSRRGEALALQIEQQVRHGDATLTAQGHCEGNCTVFPGASSTGGAGTVYSALSGITKAWKTQFHHHSLASTTDWDTLPVVTA